MILMSGRKWLRIAVVTAILLLVPLMATRWSDEVRWSPVDFVVAGLLLLGAGVVFERIADRSNRSLYRFAVGTVVLACLLLVWGNLAVGLIGDEEHPANLLYLVVLAIGLVGAGVCRFGAHGMARTAFAMALAQILVPFAALLIWRSVLATEAEPAGPIRILMGNGFFAALFAAAGLMFRRAAESRSRDEV